LLAPALVAGVAAGIALYLTLMSAGPEHQRRGARPVALTVAPSQRASVARPAAKRQSSFAVGLRVLRLSDTSRTIKLANGVIEPRTLLTYVRYPALGAPGRGDTQGAPAARADGPFPLVVFGHGFAVTPAPYARLLQSWARAGYVVAAPVFPLGNANAPGGPDESDLVNQPADMRFVISRMLAASSTSSSPLHGLLDSRQIAVAGQSDGGDTALALAYDARFRDPRVNAAVILSGAEIPGIGAFDFPPGGPPLLATQGTADTVNPPSLTNAFFVSAHRPKYLLSLIGAEHLPPYSAQQPQLGIVERVTLAFFDAYLKRSRGAVRRLLTGGRVAGVSALLAEP
jgi:dienelactone hydrolase